MVGAFVKLLKGEWSSLHQVAYLLGLSAFVSQLLALLRDRLLAGAFGAGRELDIYYAAFRVPDLLYVTVASFVSVTVLIPVLSRKMTSKNEKEVFVFVSNVAAFFVVVMVAASVIIYTLMPYLAKVIAPGFSNGSLVELTALARILLFSPFLLGLSNIFGSVVQVRKQFALYALAPLLYNLGIISGIIIFYPVMGMEGLAVGVVMGALMHFLIQLPASLSGSFRFSVNFNAARRRDLKKVVIVSVPRTITLAAHQFSLLGISALASFMGAGAIAVFNFAINLQSVPLAIFGVSYSVAAFPTLSALVARGEKEKFAEELREAARHIIFWSLPAVSLIIVLRAQIVRTVLGAGAFNWEATRLTAAALAIFSVSLLAQNLVLLLVRGYYAMGETRKPLVINTLSSLLIIISAPVLFFLFQAVPFLARFFEYLFRVSGIAGTAVLMLPLAFSIGLTVNLYFLWRHFENDFGALSIALKRTASQSLLSALLMGVVSYHSLWIYVKFFGDPTTFLGIFLQGLLSGAAGILSGAILLLTIKNEELGEFINSLRRKLSKKRLIIPESEEL